MADFLAEKKVIVFDFDGVIADSVEVKTDAFAKIYESHGKDIVSEIIRHHRNHGGMSRFEKFKYYHKTYLNVSLSEQQIDKLAQQFSKLVVDEVVSSNYILGVREFIESCVANNKICAVNSATPIVEIVEIVERRGLTHYFFEVLGSPISKRENLIGLIESSSVSNDFFVFFGDAQSDYDAAAACDVDFVGVGEYFVKSKKKFPRMSCVIPNFVQLLTH